MSFKKKSAGRPRKWDTEEERKQAWAKNNPSVRISLKKKIIWDRLNKEPLIMDKIYKDPQFLEKIKKILINS